MARRVAFAAVAGCLAYTARGKSGLRFVAVGDWGGDSDTKPTTAAQIETADGMATAASSLGADMVLMLGDNMYSRGVEDVSSSRFQKTFEDVYDQAALRALPFHIIAGNHDHRGSVQAQIDYSGKDSRWNFPSLYYNITQSWTSASGEARSVELLMVDTVSLVGNSDGEWGHVCGRELKGPEDKRAADDQWSWLQSKLEASTADFLWVAGHYPIYSAGDDGTTSGLVDQLLPLMKQHGAHYISGHDHMLEHILSEGVNMFVAGAGRECCYNDKNKDTVPDGAIQFMVSGSHGSGTFIGPKDVGTVKGGFISIDFGDESAQVAFHKEDGSSIYSVAIPRRQQAAKQMVV